MFASHLRVFRPRGLRSRGCLLIAVSIVACPGWADGLSLADAERIALDQAPSLKAVAARQVAIEQRAVAAGELPDPMLKAGFMSLPTDTFHLGQEPMTQVQVGIVQKFPRGSSRALRAEQMQERSAALGQMALDERLRLRLAVTEEYIEIIRQRKLAEINLEARSAFTELEDITRGYYATGKVQQQDVLRSAVELARVEDRATRIAQEEDRARARLEAWIGEHAWREIEPGWPEFDPPAAQEAMHQALEQHPRIAALNEQARAADTAVELADQRYKPEFGIDLTYGARGGTHPDGRDRSDLLSVMLMMDLPLFSGNRQDRLKAAAVSESSAAMYQRDDAWRKMRSEARMQWSVLQRQAERLQRFERSLLPDARDNAESALSAYQAALGDLTSLMRARINEYDLQLQYVDLHAERLKTLARLRYLQGESS